jgi:hypothetical protein
MVTKPKSRRKQSAQAAKTQWTSLPVFQVQIEQAATGLVMFVIGGQLTRSIAEGFADGFNRAERRQPLGSVAVVVRGPANK